ncbi:hypothetical protein HHZ58_001513 [Salmonella enterica]|nr:hypothetical protein [Salmonella enterica]
MRMDIARWDVFPAPAGINRDALGRLVFTERVPRASGDKPLLGVMRCRKFWCSPRQRG